MIQENEEGERTLIACGSTRLTKAQKGYSTTELELAGFLYAVKKTRYWLKGAPHVVVMTDHKSLVGISRKSFDEIDNE